MKTRIIVGIIIAILLCIGLGIICNSTHVVAEQETPQITYTKEELTTLIAEMQTIKEHCHTMAESGRALGWVDSDELIQDLQTKWHKADEDQVEYQKLLDDIILNETAEANRIEAERIAAEEDARQAEELKWSQKAAEYPAATQIWRFMKDQGWNDYVCAGIMGNLMAEVGGQTLDIRYTLSSSGYYGMCQWSRGYSQVWGAGLETQCEFLKDTIKYEFDTYGFKYQKGFNFNSFLNMTDAEQAALAFAKSYERCASASYGIRQSNALKAYNYFVN